MNIDIVGRVRPPTPGEVSGLVYEGNRVMAERGGVGHNFNILFLQDSPNAEIFNKTVQPLLDLFIAGFNTCVFVYGESGSGKSFTMTGGGQSSSNQEPGIAPQSIGYITNHIQKQNEKNPTQRSNPQVSARAFDERGRVLMYCYEIYNENIKDLMASRGAMTTRTYNEPLELATTAQKGTYIKNLSFDVCRNTMDAITAYWQAWSARTNQSSELGPVKNFATYIMQLELFMMTDENPLPNRSVFSIIRLPGIENMSEDLTRARLGQSNLTRGMSSFSKLVAELARQPEPNRSINYSDSKLTSVMEDIIGGNCKTRVICCLKPSVNRTENLSGVLNGCGMLAQVKNYPIINDCLAQDLMTQYRTRGSIGVSDFQDNPGIMSKSELQDQLMKLTGDNTQLRERNDRLFQRLEQSQDKMSSVSKSKSELSAKLVASEEEKLRVSKSMIELQLQNNRLQEEFEAENFDLKNKILTLENQLVEFELEKNKFARNNDISAEHARQLNANRIKIQEDFASLKKKSEAQEKELKSQRQLNNDMRAELSKLIETEAALLDIRDNIERRRKVHDDAERELEKARKVLRDVNFPIENNKAFVNGKDVQMDVIEQLRARREEIHRQTLDRQKSILRSSRKGKLKINEDKMTSEALLRVRKVFDEQTAELENKLSELKSQISTAYLFVQSMTMKRAEEDTNIEILKEQQISLKNENTTLQNLLKEANEDYRKKLWKYIQDISNFVDNTNKMNKSKQKYQNEEDLKDSMKIETDKMFQEMKAAFRIREEQLTKAAHNFKKQSKRIAIKQELLLIHYRHQRDQLILASEMQQNLPVFQIGPQPSKLILDENNLASKNKIELDKLRMQVENLGDELQNKNFKIEKIKDKNNFLSTRKLSASSTYSSLSLKKIKSLDSKEIASIEKERADLITKVNVAEQRTVEQQEYIDSHLKKYKEEIVRLRKVIQDQNIEVDLAPLSPNFTRTQSFRY